MASNPTSEQFESSSRDISKVFFKGALDEGLHPSGAVCSTGHGSSTKPASLQHASTHAYSHIHVMKSQIESSLRAKAPEEALRDALAQADAKWLLLQTEDGPKKARVVAPLEPAVRS